MIKGIMRFRGSAKDHRLRGYEVVFEPCKTRVVLRRHAGELEILARAAANLPTGRGVPLRIEAAEARIRGWIRDDLTLVFDVTDPKPILTGGRVGLRTPARP